MEQRIQPVKAVTQVVLVVGFGALLAMMALAGIDSINVLVQIQARNFETRQNYLTRNRALEQIRAGLYLSGTSAQDYLLEQNPQAAENYRATLQTARNDISKALANYARSLSAGQKASFRSLQAEIESYWQTLEPIFHWDPREKQQRSETFMHNVLKPRRTA